MSEHKWYHFIATHQENGSYKNTIMNWDRTVTDHYSIRIVKCDICKEWKVTIHDFKESKVIEKPWMDREKAMKWLKENEYNHNL